MTRTIRILLATTALVAAFGAGHATGFTMSADETSLRTSLLACAIIEEAGERGISSSRLTITRLQCSRAR